MKIKMTPENLRKLKESMQLDQKMGNMLEEMDFQLAESIPWQEYKTLTAQMKKAELLFKTYVLACAKNDKELRVDTMRVFKEMLKALPKMLIKYRNHVMECLNDKKEECSKKECPHE